MPRDSVHIHCTCRESYPAVPHTCLVASDDPNLAVFLLSFSSRLAGPMAGVYRTGHGAGPGEVPENKCIMWALCIYLSGFLLRSAITECGAGRKSS